jgi:hypothetical protein
MPLARYFSYVGGVLLAVLFIVDAWFPTPPVAERPHAGLPVIRIHSDRKWPERVVYDTSLPTIVPTPSATAEVAVRTPQTVADAPAGGKAQEAFAMLQLSADPVQGSKAKVQEPRPRHQNRIARKRSPASLAPRFAMARHPQFGWFGGNFW